MSLSLAEFINIALKIMQYEAVAMFKESIVIREKLNIKKYALYKSYI